MGSYNHREYRRDSRWEREPEQRGGYRRDWSSHHRGGRYNERRVPYDPKKLPDRWINYDGIGCDMEGTSFLPFKTPLDKSFFDNKPQHSVDDQFDVDLIVQLARENGKHIGLVIDLTNTNRYYDKDDWGRHDVQYVKINCPGHEVDNREDIVEKFNTLVEEFIAEKENEGKLIGVHCTHGLNRTGYLICRYLIDKRNWKAAAAISAFEVARKHPIERASYKLKLYEAEANLIGVELIDEVDDGEDETVKKNEAERKAVGGDERGLNEEKETLNAEESLVNSGNPETSHMPVRHKPNGSVHTRFPDDD